MATIRQAGAIVVRGTPPDAEVLLVRAKKNPSQWIFPKGHIEPGEAAEDTALRELREEAGVEGELLRPAGTASFESGGENVTVDYYVVRFTGTIGPGDGRQTRWTSFDEARSLLTFDESREHLRAAERVLSGSQA